MASAGTYINDFNYNELSQNYDAIYDTLVSGGIVWMRLNFNNISWRDYPIGEDGYLRFMVTQWYVDYQGLSIICPDGSVLRFPNGSHHTPSSPK